MFDLGELSACTDNQGQGIYLLQGVRTGHNEAVQLTRSWQACFHNKSRRKHVLRTPGLAIFHHMDHPYHIVTCRPGPSLGRRIRVVRQDVI